MLFFPKGSSYRTRALGRITRWSHITYYSLMFFIAYAFIGQAHVFAGRVKIVSYSSCRTSAILEYFCPLLTTVLHQATSRCAKFLAIMFLSLFSCNLTRLAQKRQGPEPSCEHTTRPHLVQLLTSVCLAAWHSQTCLPWRCTTDLASPSLL